VVLPRRLLPYSGWWGLFFWVGTPTINLH